jgi:hypothetical protein
MLRTRPWLVTSFALVFCTISNTASRASQADAETVLRSRGLTKQGRLYVVEKEGAFLEKLGKVQPLYDELKNRYAGLAAIAQQQSEYDQIDLRYEFVTEQLRKVQAEQDASPPNSNNFLKQRWQELLDLEKQLRFERSELNREINLRYKDLVPDSRKQRLLDEFQQRREEFLRQSHGLLPLIDEINARYAELAKDDAVKKALERVRQSAKTAVVLGPSSEFKKRSTQLKRAEKELAPPSITSRKRGSKSGKNAAKRGGR